MRYRITAPVAGFDGRSAGVSFADGVAEIDGDTQGRALTYFRRRGYGVVELDGDEETVVEDVQAPADGGPSGPVGDVQTSGQAAAASQAATDRAASQAEMPKRSASKEAWRDYAVSQGMSVVEANSKSRDELAAHYTKEGDQ